jgi:tetratricopeptide (TPR) repeat protein
MENKGKLAELRHAHRQLPEMMHASFKLIFCLASLAFLCISAVAQENTTEYWMDRAEDLTHNGSIDEAIAAYDEALKIEPENTTILIRKASDLNIMGKANESLEIYQKALGLLDQELKGNQSDAEAWQEKAGILRSLNRQNESTQAYEKALESYDSRIEKNPKDVDAWIGKGNALTNLGKWDEAGDAYNKAIEIDPQDSRAWGRKAEVIGRIGDINESMEAFDKAIELLPPNKTRELSAYWMSKAEVLAFAGTSDESQRTVRLEEALEAINHSLELDPSSRVNWRFKADILSELGRKDEAVEAFDEILKQNPEDADSWLWKANLLVEMKRYNESVQAYEKAIGLIPENNTEDLALNGLSKGWALNKTGRQEEAKVAFQKSLEFYDQAISNNTGNNRLLQQKGLVLFELGRYDEAIEAYDQVLSDSPDVKPSTAKTSAWIGKGDALRALGKNEEAISAYNKAIELSPHYSNAWHGKGEAQKAMGQVGNASMSFSMAEKLGYEE